MARDNDGCTPSADGLRVEDAVRISRKHNKMLLSVIHRNWLGKNAVIPANTCDTVKYSSETKVVLGQRDF
jgi:hypothetical protein